MRHVEFFKVTRKPRRSTGGKHDCFVRRSVSYRHGNTGRRMTHVLLSFVLTVALLLTYALPMLARAAWPLPRPGVLLF